MKHQIEIYEVNKDYYFVQYKDSDVVIRDFETRKQAERFAKRFCKMSNCELVG